VKSNKNTIPGKSVMECKSHLLTLLFSVKALTIDISEQGNGLDFIKGSK